jgi:hypothetical protein
LGFGLGAVMWFALWAYNRTHLGMGRGTIPIRAISKDGEFSQTMIVPINATFAWDSGYYFAIVAIVCEAVTTLISWIAGTEKCLWSSRSDVVYGPDSWIYGVDYDYPDRMKRPTLTQLGQYRNTRDVMLV